MRAQPDVLRGFVQDSLSTARGRRDRLGNVREKELRLALVCYGGISLAVYMHGITREVWKLLRASRAYHDERSKAPDGDTEPVSAIQPRLEISPEITGIGCPPGRGNRVARLPSRRLA